MPIIIENISEQPRSDDQKHSYRLRINGRRIAVFEHRRDEGLAECLRRAAEAIDAAREGGPTWRALQKTQESM